MYKVSKVDRRFLGFGDFEYIVNSNNYGIKRKYDFFTLREWCWTTFGPSKEIHEWLDDYRNPTGVNYILHHNKAWCWHLDNYTKRIYLGSEKELVLFNLRFL